MKSVSKQYISGLPKYAYRYGRPEGIVIHETANPGATAQNNHDYEARTWGNAFVHAIVDHGIVIQQANPSYLSWGSGPYGNARFIQIELANETTYGNFVKGVNNDAYYVASLFKQYGIKPSLVDSVGTSGTLWSHANVSNYLGGSDHSDPVGYFSQYGYSMKQFYSLVMKYYNGSTGSTSSVGGSTKLAKATHNYESTGTIKSGALVYKRASGSDKLVPNKKTSANTKVEIKRVAVTDKGSAYYSTYVNGKYYGHVYIGNVTVSANSKWRATSSGLHETQGKVTNYATLYGKYTGDQMQPKAGSNSMKSLTVNTHYQYNTPNGTFYSVYNGADYQGMIKSTDFQEIKLDKVTYADPASDRNEATVNGEGYMLYNHVKNAYANMVKYGRADTLKGQTVSIDKIGTKEGTKAGDATSWYRIHTKAGKTYWVYGAQLNFGAHLKETDVSGWTTIKSGHYIYSGSNLINKIGSTGALVNQGKTGVHLTKKVTTSTGAVHYLAVQNGTDSFWISSTAVAKKV